MFNALKYTEELEKAGFTRAQAETSVKLLVDAMNENLATRSDLSELKFVLRSDLIEFGTQLRAEFKNDSTELRSELKGDLAELRSELKNDLAELRSELKGDFAGLRDELKGNLAELQNESKGDLTEVKTDISSLTHHVWKLDSRMQSMESSMKTLEYKLTIKLGSMMVIAIGVATTLIRFLPASGH